MSLEVLFWVQHLLGSGHLKRTLVLSAALADAGHRVTIMSGGRPVPWPIPKAIRFVQLPWIASPDTSFRSLETEHGSAPGDEIWGARGEAIEATVMAARPDVVVTEMYPFGRRKFQREVQRLIERSREVSPQAKIVASVRDILVSTSDSAKALWMVGAFERDYDAALVHGDPALIRLEQTLEPARPVRSRFLYTGYVQDRAPGAARRRDRILVSAGGGRVGHDLLETAVDAAQNDPRPDRHWHIIAGAHFPQEAFEALGGDASSAAITIERFNTDFPALLASATVSVSQAGYNTVAEALAAMTPMVLVPFRDGGEDEQFVRAAILERKGLAITCDPQTLDRVRLLDAIERTGRLDPERAKDVATDGADRTMQHLEELVRRGRR